MADEDGPSIAADGGYIPGACNTLGEFIQTLEDGQFSADCYQAVKQLNADLCDTAFHNGGKAKGKLTIVVDIAQEGGVVSLKSTYKVVSPEPPRAKSILWQTPDNRFTRHRPGQRQLFGEVIDGGARAGGFRDAS
ncbi:hypothetical protein [Sphingomonas montanisoli]|uniref:Uncharacterized protein n=1 Tax=Sphingomonas montanisoli TaxID=2606412 RepID=A0A5D9BZ73_9SPHN|nr:hypothetical protein [Sphingomonas montanisoli]TZG24888.1 hypothetical protein FYJ91_16540 [Sphingomonas montanisoli]